MRVLLLHAHPVAESFNTALAHHCRDELTAAGHDVDYCDLYAEGFDPVMSAEERTGYHDVASNRQRVADYVARLTAAQALVLVFPVWNFGYPAILKGFFDRVFLPGVSFELQDGQVRGILHNIESLTAVTSYGGTKWQAFLAGDAPRKIVTRVLRHTIKPGAAVRYLAHYDMNRSTDASRADFLAKIGATMRTL